MILLVSKLPNSSFYIFLLSSQQRFSWLPLGWMACKYPNFLLQCKVSFIWLGALEVAFATGKIIVPKSLILRLTENFLADAFAFLWWCLSCLAAAIRILRVTQEQIMDLHLSLTSIWNFFWLEWEFGFAIWPYDDHTHTKCKLA